MATALGVDALELRNLEASDSGWPVKELYYTFRKPITADNDANLKAIPNRQRAMIRKGIKEGLVAGIQPALSGSLASRVCSGLSRVDDPSG